MFGKRKRIKEQELAERQEARRVAERGRATYTDTAVLEAMNIVQVLLEPELPEVSTGYELLAVGFIRTDTHKMQAKRFTEAYDRLVVMLDGYTNFAFTGWQEFEGVITNTLSRYKAFYNIRDQVLIEIFNEFTVFDKEHSVVKNLKTSSASLTKAGIMSPEVNEFMQALAEQVAKTLKQIDKVMALLTLEISGPGYAAHAQSKREAEIHEQYRQSLLRYKSQLEARYKAKHY